MSFSNPMLYTSTGWVQHLGISWMSLVSGACILWFLDKTMVNNFTDVPFQYTIILTYSSGDAMSRCNIDLNIVSCLHLCSGYFSWKCFFSKSIFHLIGLKITEFAHRGSNNFWEDYFCPFLGLNVCTFVWVILQNFSMNIANIPHKK